MTERHKHSSSEKDDTDDYSDDFSDDFSDGDTSSVKSVSEEQTTQDQRQVLCMSSKASRTSVADRELPRPSVSVLDQRQVLCMSSKASRTSVADRELPRPSVTVLGRGGRNQNRGRGRGRGGGLNSQARSHTKPSVVTKRLLSANRLKTNELTNQLEEMKKQLKVVTEENKLFKRLQHKQEKALGRLEDRESELPQLLEAHSNEVRSLKEQLRCTREKYEKTERSLRDAEGELNKVNSKAKKYKALADDKGLKERSELDKQLKKAECIIEEKDSMIKELERHVEILKKNHRFELGIERARYKDAQKQLDDLKENSSKLETVLKEKEKLLEARNISKPQGSKPALCNGTPAESAALWRQSLNKKKSESLSDLTPRDKARAYDEKRKGKEREKKNEKLRLPRPNLSSDPESMEKPPPSQRMGNRPAEVKQKQEKEGRVKEDATSITNSKNKGPECNFSSLHNQDSEADFRRRKEDKYKQDRDNRGKQEERSRNEAQEEESTRFQQQRKKFQDDMEERERRERKETDERERRDEERQRREREERERKEEERKRREKMERKEREERERFEALRRAMEEKEKLDNDTRLVKDRSKKEEFLRRLQQHKANRDGSQPESNPDLFAPADSTRRRAGGGRDHTQNTPSDLFASLASRKDKDPFSAGDRGFSTSPSYRKDIFSQPVENMHRAKPAHEESRHRRSRDVDDADIGGYQPSFSDTASPSKNKTASPFDDFEAKPAPRTYADRKSKLMFDLFGSAATTTTAKKDDGDSLFMTSPPAVSKAVTQGNKKASGISMESSPIANTNWAVLRESSNLFGGGAALVDDDLSPGGEGQKSTLLPKRSRQPTTTFSSKPTMGDVDHLDDDIEEVVL